MKPDEKLIIGWREWVGLPELGLNSIKAKVDTGARTSTLHAFELDTFSENGVDRVNFKIHPVQKDSEKVVNCVSDIVDEVRHRFGWSQGTTFDYLDAINHRSLVVAD